MKEEDISSLQQFLPPARFLTSSNVRKQVRNKDQPTHLRAYACTSANAPHCTTETHAIKGAENRARLRDGMCTFT